MFRSLATTVQLDGPGAGLRGLISLSLSFSLYNMEVIAPSLRPAAAWGRAHCRSSQNKYLAPAPGPVNIGLFHSFLVWSQASLSARKTLKTLPRASRRAVFWWLDFLFYFVWGLFFFYLALIPPSNMLLVFKALVASSPVLPPSVPRKTAPCHSASQST
jgi:hypothetical protein